MLDEESLRKLLREEYRKTVKLMERLLHNTDADAEGETTTVWENFWTNCSKPEFKFTKSPKSYLYKMLRNQAIDVLEKYVNRPYQVIYPDVDGWRQIADRNGSAVQAMTFDPDEICARTDIQNMPEIRQPHLWTDQMLEALGKLRPTERLVILAAVQDETGPTETGPTNGELAKIINTHYKEFIKGKLKTEDAVKKARQRALQALEKHLREVPTDRQTMKEGGE